MNAIRRLPRALVLALVWSLAVIAAGVLGFGAASAVVSSSGGEVSAVALVPAADGDAHPRAAVADLDARSRPWAVRVYESQTALTCPEAGRVDGQVRDGQFGTVGNDGKFNRQPLRAAEFGEVDPESGSFIVIPKDDAGSCVDPAKVQDATVVVNHYPAEGVRGARAVAFGVLADNVNQVDVELDGSRVPAAVAEGAYVAVLQEDNAPRASLVFTRTDGSTKVVPWVLPGKSDPAVLPPPEQPAAPPAP